MKSILRTTITALVLFTTTYIVQAQAWDRHTNTLSIGIGPSQFFHIDNYYYNDGPAIRPAYYWPVTGQFNFQGEFGIHKYVGLGFTTGIGGRGPISRDYLGELNVPVGMIANFHFYQLIADHASRNIHADKLDIYAGANLGSGVAFTYYTNTVRVAPLAFGGVQAGIRYYFAPRVAINGELGFGKSIANVGFTFKL
ncbi:MAG: hypothetical protein RLZZ367_1226 [Bacteroidota bacterium]|jgi:hypothetical protein